MNENILPIASHLQKNNFNSQKYFNNYNLNLFQKHSNLRNDLTHISISLCSSDIAHTHIRFQVFVQFLVFLGLNTVKVYQLFANSYFPPRI